MEARIFLALRFHVNFYHSYRGDSLDERGIGKDIRVIRGILDDLDSLNSGGVPVRGAWDIENHWSMGTMMRRSAPELLERIRGRVGSGVDEAEPMSWNNGIVSASTAEEFDEQMRLTKSNPQASGLEDVFGSWSPVLRPQECMYTPSFLERYPAAGVGAISLYNSALPFNGFSTLVPPLGFAERYNPLRLRSASLQGSMTLLPCYNNGDIADNFLSLRRWIRGMRRKQLAMAEPRDLLLLIDHDADDEFWAGMKIPLIGRAFPSFEGLRRMVGSVAALPYLVFTTPGSYLEGHEAVGELVLDQDTADGSFDGYSSWAEKWDNTELWSLIQRSRTACDYAGYLARRGTGPGRIGERLGLSLRQRLLAMSTTHFGMASPVMNTRRLADGLACAKAALAPAEEALRETRAASAPRVAPAALLFPDGLEAPAAAGIARLGGSEAGAALALAPGTVIAWDFMGERHALVRCSLAEGSRECRLESPRNPGAAPPAAAAAPRAERGFDIAPPRIRWSGALVSGSADGPAQSVQLGGGASAELHAGRILLGDAEGRWTRVETRMPGCSGVIIDLQIDWPQTAERGFSRAKASRLDRGWDPRWREIMPAEILPRFAATRDRPFTVYKRNFFGDSTSYRLDYHSFSRNSSLASFNNHITNAWVAVGNGERGILVAQHEGLGNNFAFCPMRCSLRGSRQEICLNPFGTYYGPQWRYPTAVTGLGRALALLVADQLDSYAPSFNGKRSRFSIAVYDFEGHEPPAGLRSEAELYAAAPILLA